MPSLSSFPVKLTLGVCAAALLGYGAWHMWGGHAPAGGGMKGMGGLPVEATPVAVQPMAETIDVVGQLQAEHGAVLKAETTGRVLRILVKDGARVKAGDLLVQLDDTTARATLAQAEANVAVSTANEGRYARLQAVGAASQLQLDEMTAAAKLARANVQAARAALAKTRLVAPFDGVAGVVQVTLGEMVNAGQSVVAVTDNAHFKVTLTLPETAASAAIDTPVDIMNDAGEVFPARLAALDGRIDPDTRTMAAKVLLDVKQGNSLITGQFIRVRVPVRSVSEALVVPDAALVAEGNTSYVYTVNAGPKGMTMASKTTVNVGLRVKNMVQLTSGVRPGQFVVTAGQQKLMAPVMPVTMLSPTVVTRATPAVETLDSGNGK